MLKASGKRRMQRATALVNEEKGSDVNLATHLLLDAVKNDYDAAVVVSDDAEGGLLATASCERSIAMIVMSSFSYRPRAPSVNR